VADGFDSDVVVVGSGAAGLSAALAAAAGGTKVILLERSELVGGTSAYSGGMSWVPCSAHFADVAGTDDSRDEAAAYIRSLVQDRSFDDSLIDTFLDHGAQAVEFLQKYSPLRLHTSRTYTDYFADRPGGTTGGRSLIPEPFDARATLGGWFALLQDSPHFPMPLTLDEMAIAAGADPRNANRAVLSSTDLKELADSRLADGVVTNGRALVGALLAGALQLGVEVRTGWRLRRLVVSAGAVTGVVAEHEGEEVEVTARLGVVLANGGFEWNDDLVLTYLGTTGTKPLSTPANVGDGLVAALAHGAATANMTSGWNYPVTSDPSRRYMGAPLASIQSTRFEPGSIAVNSAGKRFVNEGAAYVDVGKAFARYDEVTQTYPNLAGAWLIFDQSVRDRAIVVDMRPGEPTPRWMVEASSLAGLARQLGIPAKALEATVREFNDDVDAGVDTQFGRGTVWFEGQTKGGPSPEKALARIERAPFYAMGFYHGLLGTAGGLRIDGNAQVLSLVGNPIRGLHACGNVASSPFGPMYPGGGTTLGLAITFGFLAGRHTAASRP
jgi:3-oxosteroid 1-dehydrogenase